MNCRKRPILTAVILATAGVTACDDRNHQRAASITSAGTAVEWDCGELKTDAKGSDLFPITWSDDDHQYVAWGDGAGFEGNTRFGYGISRIEGSARSYTATDVGEFSRGGGGGKISGIISIAGTLYVWRNEQDREGTHTLVYSRDKGRRVQATSVSFTIRDDGLVPNSFVQFGMDNADALDEYVYSIANGGDGGPTYILRVTASEMEIKGAYETLSELSGEVPQWSRDLSKPTPIFTNPEASTWSGAYVTYFKPLQKYILTERSELDLGVWAIYEGPNPWGPWTRIERYTDWCGWRGRSTGIVLGRIIAPRWISEDGHEFWMIFSGSDEWDRFNLIRGRFNTRTNQGAR